jgi:hypothetical protein
MCILIAALHVNLACAIFLHLNIPTVIFYDKIMLIYYSVTNIFYILCTTLKSRFSSCRQGLIDTFHREVLTLCK